jgi:hypothetical protein
MGSSMYNDVETDLFGNGAALTLNIEPLNPERLPYFFPGKYRQYLIYA